MQLVNNSNVYPERFPSSTRAFRFIPGGIRLVKRGSTYVGFCVRLAPKTRERIDALGLSIAADEDGFGPMRGSCDLFLISYRNKTCTKCGVDKSSIEFHQKSSGAEGPFPEAWRKLDSWCRPCRSRSKAARYKEKARAAAEAKRKRRQFRTVLDVQGISVEESYCQTNDGRRRHDTSQFLVERLVGYT
jgi:hypothetical protein